MRPIRSILSKLPGIAFATLLATGETVALRAGEAGYYKVATGKSADELNALYGVSRPEAQAMLAGATLGWQSPLADPDNYDARGELRADRIPPGTPTPRSMQLTG